MFKFKIRGPLLVLVLALAMVFPVVIHGEERSVSVDGLSVVYDEYGEGDRTVVFIPGWCCDSSAWSRQVAGLSGDFHLLVVDLPGLGRSDKPKDVVYSLDLMADAVAAVMDDSKASMPVVVGHSMGYSVAVRLLCRRPDLVEAIVNVDGAYLRPMAEGQDPDGWEPEMKGFLTRLGGPEAEEARRWFVGCTFYDKTEEPLQGEIMDMMMSAESYVAYSSMAAFIRPEEWKVTSFSVPALAIYSDHQYMPEDNEEDLRKYFPEMVYELWDDTGHFLMMQRPERFNDSLRRFVDDL